MCKLWKYPASYYYRHNYYWVTSSCSSQETATAASFLWWLCSSFLLCCQARKCLENSTKTFFDLVTLTSELELDILPLDLHAKFLVCMYVSSAVRVVTHIQTHTQTMSKLLHPSLMRGVITLWKKIDLQSPILSHGLSWIFGPRVIVYVQMTSYSNYTTSIQLGNAPTWIIVYKHLIRTCK